ncbi:hypothetical protein HMN09_01359500 [Mycena chlorophos]|uniref:Uncharacterized protein n=1 Tax=Mycena chlorophos TaxID=658473 RepID=A0A8H6VT54_MYCCL|nr:hypothetical protein HMN09_01359500 [Mycena chlorophos]
MNNWQDTPTSFVTTIVINTTIPTTTLTSAAACAACFAPIGDRAPMRFPTLADAATPIPNGMVFRTGLRSSPGGNCRQLSQPTSCKRNDLKRNPFSCDLEG